MTQHGREEGWKVPTDRSSLDTKRKQACLDELSGLFGTRCSSAASVREHHGRGLSHLNGAAPDAVVFPESAEEVSDVVRTCSKHGIPMIAFGAGTSAEDHVAAVEGGVCIDMSGLNRVVEIRTDDFIAIVEPGVTRKQLNNALRDTGLFFSVDPGADASIGGMTATRASGTSAVRYGTMRDNVVSVDMILWDGQHIRTGSLAPKSSAGYDLTALAVGSEGTLGIMTRIAVRLHPRPEATSSLACSFPDLGSAVDAAIMLRKLGVPVARVELMDTLQMKACNAYSGTNYPETPCLLLELHGSKNMVVEQAVIVREIFEDAFGTDISTATSNEEQTKLWSMRHDAYHAACALRPRQRAQPTDVCVPISRLAECIAETIADFEAHGIVAPICGHVGDGNFHALMMFDPHDAEDVDRIRQTNARLVERAIRMEGTCTGEHGIGRGKLDYMELEHGAAVEVMAKIKQALDPLGLLNPGKVIPQHLLSAPSPVST